MAKTKLQNSPKVLGLDVSTTTIGWALFDIQSKQLLELTHISPRPNHYFTPIISTQFKHL